MRVSKSVLVNLQYLDCVEPSFGGIMLLVLKNGCKDYISRKYLPAFKNILVYREVVLYEKFLGKIAFGIAIGCFGFVSMLFIASAFAGGANTFIGQKQAKNYCGLLHVSSL